MSKFGKSEVSAGQGRQKDNKIKSLTEVDIAWINIHPAVSCQKATRVGLQRSWLVRQRQKVQTVSQEK